MMVVTALKTQIKQNILENIIRRFSSFEKMRKCLAYILSWRPEVKSIFQAREKAFKMLIETGSLTRDEATGVGRQYLVEDGEDGLMYCLPRKMYHKGDITQQRLVLVSGRSEVGRALVTDLHIHCSGVGREIARMFQKGIFISRHRYLFKKLQLSCSFCRRLRKKQISATLGPNIQLEAARRLPRMSVLFIDCLGYFYHRVSHNRKQKIWLILLTCVVTRYSVCVILENMKASSILMGLKSCFLQVGGVQNCVLHSDRGSNLIPLMKLDAEERGETGAEVDEEELVTGLRKTLHRNNIVLKTNLAASSWRAGMVEIKVKQLKLSLERSGVLHKTHSLQKWQYLILVAQNNLNNIPLNVNYMDGGFEVLTPNRLMHGSERTAMMQDIDLDNIAKGGEKLFGKLAEFDAELKKFEKMFWESYALEIKKWMKWKTGDRKLKVGDCVFLLDKINKNTNLPYLGVVKKVLSDRSYTIEFIQKEARVNPTTFEILRVARKSTLDRPAQQLALIASQEECKDFSVDPQLVPNVGEEPEDISMYVGEEVGNKTEVERDNMENEEVMEQVIEEEGHEQNVADLPIADYESYRDQEAKTGHEVVYPDVPQGPEHEELEQKDVPEDTLEDEVDSDIRKMEEQPTVKKKIVVSVQNVTDDKIVNIEAVEQRDAKKYKVSEPKQNQKKKNYRKRN